MPFSFTDFEKLVRSGAPAADIIAAVRPWHAAWIGRRYKWAREKRQQRMSGRTVQPDKTLSSRTKSLSDINGHVQPDIPFFLPFLPSSIEEERKGEFNIEKLLFEYGKRLLGKDAGSLIARLRKQKGSDELAFAALLTAAGKQDPREYVGAMIRGNGAGRGVRHSLDTVIGR